MISNQSIARHISEVALGISSKLDESILFVKENCSEEEFQKYRVAAGRVLGQILLEILNPLYETNPTLRPPELH